MNAKKYRYVPLVMTMLLLQLLVSSCTVASNKAGSLIAEPQSHTYFIFDTIITLRVFDDRMKTSHFTEVEQLLNRIDREMNRQRAGSEIDQINQMAGLKAVAVSEETFRVIQTALEYSESSDGKFDLTIGPLVTLWGIGSESAAVPDSSSLDQALKLIDYTKVTLDEPTFSVMLAETGMSLDLGSIAKGFAADVIADYLTAHHMNSAIIDLGGNIIALGAKPNGSDWSIGIQAPDKQRGQHLGLIKVKDKTIVTSGIYERFFEENGTLYHHIFNTTTGYPVANNLLSVTIVTEVSMDADALSTTVFALGLEAGLTFIEQRKDVEAIFVTTAKEIHLSPGLKGIFELTNHNYTLAP
jgi:thiamine biosynthesis lipoprotein